MTTAELQRALVLLEVDVSKLKGGGAWVTVKCPVCHARGSESLSLRIDTSSGGFKCHRCQASSSPEGGGKNLLQFLEDPTAPSLAGVTAGQDLLHPLTEDLVARYSDWLLSSPATVQDLERIRGW